MTGRFEEVIPLRQDGEFENDSNTEDISVDATATAFEIYRDGRDEAITVLGTSGMSKSDWDVYVFKGDAAFYEGDSFYEWLGCPREPENPD